MVPGIEEHRVEEFNISRAVAQFCSVYPGEFQNGLIPWNHFWMLYYEMDSVLAMHRVQMTTSVATGTGMVMNGDKNLKRIADNDIRTAFH
jgi:hypothetical protein